MSATLVDSPTTPAPARPSTAAPRAWKVLLHNDEVNSFEHVIRSLRGVLRLQLELAWGAADEAHREGLATVARSHREHAELIQEQLQSCGLTSTIEPD